LFGAPNAQLSRAAKERRVSRILKPAASRFQLPICGGGDPFVSTAIIGIGQIGRCLLRGTPEFGDRP
jgi:hypothetical protein